MDDCGALDPIAVLVAEANGMFVSNTAAQSRLRTHTSTSGHVRTDVSHFLRQSPLLQRARAQPLLPLVRLIAPALERERVFDLKVPSLRRLLLTSNALNTALSPHAARILNDISDSDAPAFAQAVYECVTYLPAPVTARSHTIASADELLHKLASCSAFSVDATGAPLLVPKTTMAGNLAPLQLQHHQRRQRQDLVFQLFNNTPAATARLLAQVVLKIPATRFHESWILTALHASFWQTFKVQPNLRAACAAVEERRLSLVRDSAKALPREIHLGANVANMALGKATSCAHAVRHMEKLGECEFAAEVKYDGERNQIHILPSADLSDADARPRIVMFSKSKRNSTHDRVLSHDIILATICASPVSSISEPVLDPLVGYLTVDSAIFDSELLVFDERSKTVLPFHEARIFASENSRKTDSAILDGQKHYLLVFFDILFLNGASLFQMPYSERRQLLKRVIRPIPNYSMISESRTFSLREGDACAELRCYFLEVCARPGEGVVCKGLTGTYNPGCDSLWLKLKKDYIEGFGDTADFAVIGGSYRHDLTDFLGLTRRDDERLLNIFFVACLVDRAQESPTLVPVFEFSAGFSRDSLLYFSQHSHPHRRSDASALGYSVVGKPTGKVEFWFDPPIAVELKGGGFERRNGGRWSLRGPRFLRLCGADRGWRESITYAEFSAMAERAAQPAPGASVRLEMDRLCAIDAAVASKPARRRSMAGVKRPRSTFSDRRSSLVAAADLNALEKTATENVRAMRHSVTAIDDCNGCCHYCDNIGRAHDHAPQCWKNPTLRDVTDELLGLDALVWLPGSRQRYKEPDAQQLLRGIVGDVDCRRRMVHSLSALVSATGWDGGNAGIAVPHASAFRPGFVVTRDATERDACIAVLQRRCRVAHWMKPKPLIVICHDDLVRRS
ncbi:hypothetical protein HDU84_006978 [Entophlyctis sp. JEL0112]|nr:hypothetical protein HDU84_006978 [Entophlyctis sp. JEL0112]